MKKYKAKVMYVPAKILLKIVISNIFSKYYQPGIMVDLLHRLERVFPVPWSITVLLLFLIGSTWLCRLLGYLLVLWLFNFVFARPGCQTSPALALSLATSHLFEPGLHGSPDAVHCVLRRC